MKSLFVKFLLFFLIFVLSNPTPTWAYISQQNTAATVVSTTGTQDNPEIVSDNNGGSIVIWADDRSGNFDIYAQRFDSTGATVWTSNGVVVANTADAEYLNQYYHQVLADGNGGAFIVYRRTVSATSYLYAQHINSSGATTWTSGGVRVSELTGTQLYPSIDLDGAGGIYIAFTQTIAVGTNDDIYAQGINSSGAVQWGNNGVAICDETSNQKQPTLVNTGSGAYIAWSDDRNSGGGNPWDIYTQRVNTSGADQLADNGVRLTSSAEEDNNPYMIYATDSTPILAWANGSAGSRVIIVKKLDSSAGSTWTSTITTASRDFYVPYLVGDSSGGAFITFGGDLDNGTNYFTDIFIQRVDSNGDQPWGDAKQLNPVHADMDSSAVEMNISGHGTGAASVSWEDYYNDDGSFTNGDVFAQRVDEDGTFLLNSGDALQVATSANTEGSTTSLLTNNQVAVVWVDGTATDINLRIASLNYQVSNIDAGLLITDTNNNNIAVGQSNGLYGSSMAVVKNAADSTYMARVAIDFTIDRSFSGLTGTNNLTDRKTLIQGLPSVEGFDASYSIYVPKNADDQSVVLCPGATSLTDITTTCTNRELMNDSSTNVTVVTVGGQDYWYISNLTDANLGGVSTTNTLTELTASPVPSPSPSASPTPASNSSSNNSSSSSSNNSSSVNNTFQDCHLTPPSSAPDLFQIDAGGNKARIYFSPVLEANKYFIYYGPANNPRANAFIFDHPDNKGVVWYDVSKLEAKTQY